MIGTQQRGTSGSGAEQSHRAPVCFSSPRPYLLRRLRCTHPLMSPEVVAGLAASIVTVGGGLVAAVRWYARRGSPTSAARAMLAERMKPLDFELVPVRFEIDTSGTIPRVVVTLRAVNYNRKPLKLTTARISFLQVERGNLEEI